MATKMAATPEQKPILKKEVEDDPDKDAPKFSSVAQVKIKKEEPEDGDDCDMFRDVDEEVEYVDLTYEGFAEINGVDHFVCEQFRIPRIQEPTVIKRPLRDLFDQIESGNLVLDPAYQREVVWDENRASLLITSVLMNYFIPPVLFNLKPKVRMVGGQKKTYIERTCVDGKQRLTSIWRFMKGQLGFFDTSHPAKKWYFCHPVVNGVETVSTHNILPDAVKNLFRDAYFCCYEYEELTLHVEETMFQLVQRGVALTAAEKMRALSTDWALFTKKYEDDYSLVINLSKQNRGSGFRLILTIFTMVQEVMAGRKKRSSAPTLQASPAALGRVLDEKEHVTPALKLRFKAIFDRYEKLVKLSSTVLHSKYKLNRNSAFDPHADFLQNDASVSHVQTFSPLELVGTAILIAMHMDKRSDEELIEDIKGMRHYIRLKHKDLRVNAQCWSTTWGFISKELPSRWPSQNDTPAAGNTGSINAAVVESAEMDRISASTTRSKSSSDLGGEDSRVSVAGGASSASTPPSTHEVDTKGAAATESANLQQRTKHISPSPAKSKDGNDTKVRVGKSPKDSMRASGAVNNTEGTSSESKHSKGKDRVPTSVSAGRSKHTSGADDGGTRATKKLKTANATEGGLGEPSRKSKRGSGMGGGGTTSQVKKLQQ